MIRLKYFKESYQQINALIIIIFLFIHIITFPIRLYFPMFLVREVITFLIIIISLAINYHVSLKRNLVFLIFIMGFFVFNYWLVNFNNDYIVVYIEFIKFGGISLFLSIQDYSAKDVLKSWIMFSYLALAILVLNISRITSGEISYMFLGVHSVYIFASIFYFSLTVENKSKYLHYLFAIITFMLCIVFGNRGAILSIIMLVIALILMNSNLRTRKILFLGVFISSILIVSNVLVNLLTWLNIILRDLGLYSYSLMKLIIQLRDGFFSGLSGRDVVFVRAIELISEANMMPQGMGYYQIVISSNYYPHNIILDFLIAFGFFAPILLVALLFFIIKSFRLSGIETKNLVLIITLVSFTRLFFSGTFMTDITFWFLIGYLVKIQLICKDKI